MVATTSRVQRVAPAIPLAALAMALAFVGACATGSKPASPPTSARHGVPVDIATEVENASAPTVSLVRDAILDARLSELSIASWPEHRDAVERFYTDRGFTTAWIRKGRPTQNALDVIDLFGNASAVGLTPDDYDAGRWADRVDRLGSGDAAEIDRARFDLALTVCLVRYLADSHRGRIDPRTLGFETDLADSPPDTFDPVAVLEELSTTSKIDAVIASAAPSAPEYRRLVDALGRYRELARTEGETAPRFAARHVIRPGDTYADLPRLSALLARLGDLGTAEPIDESRATLTEADAGTLYQGAIVEAVARFQRRHGLDPDGKIGKETQEQLSIPLARRVRQIELELERLRWQQRTLAGRANGRGVEEGPAIVVNVPEFRLRAFDRSGQETFATDVVVGKAGRTETPIFTERMRTVVFRPGWYVPASITSREIVPEIEKDPTHLEREGYEILSDDGSDAGDADDVATLSDLRSGALRLRQKPGPQNALGPVKFLFPNRWNVYLHGTPSTKGFARARRDLSHGCVRVADPIGLAEWVLRDQPDWDREHIQEAVAGPRDELAVKLAKPIPVHFEYHTVMVAEDGEVFFLDDLYGHDVRLERALARRHVDGANRVTEVGSN